MNTLITLLPTLQIVISVLLVISILLQQSEESLGGAFGGSNSADSSKKIRRGGQKFMFNIAIVLAILFTITSIAAFLLK
jgi:protein translocase SecG subunit